MAEETKLDIKVIVFQLQDEEYAISVKNVSSIEKMQQITRIPQTDSLVKGVINLRGIVTPVIDLRKRFGMKETETTESTRIIVVGTGKMEVGLIVDAAYDVADVPEKAIEPAPHTASSDMANYIEGVVKLEKRLLILLNIEKILFYDSINQPEWAEG